MGKKQYGFSHIYNAEELRLVSGDDNLAVENTNLLVTEPLYEINFTLPVNLETGPNRIQVIATNNYTVSGKNNAAGFGASAEGRASHFVYNNVMVNTQEMDLWILAIGSNEYLYGSPENNLNFSANNTKGIASLLENQQGKRYRNVYSQIIADGEKIAPTRKNILNALNVFFSKAASNDVLVLYMSGHGEDNKNDTNRQYYFLPQDVPFSPDGEPDYSMAISLDDISALLDMAGRKFIFIDSCFSGGVDNRKLTKSLKTQSTAIFTSSQQGEYSWEGSGAVEYGVFTEFLIHGIQGEAAQNNEVKVSSLGDYTYKQVVWFTSDEQHPYIYVPEGLYSFVLAITDPPLK
ncbi:hypothetical protein AGMMS50293_14250 [Spirochaetia bacterium]|nr:hypothetical protein AGMMS50293_14250 [Spirochaetia bacterium]